MPQSPLAHHLPQTRGNFNGKVRRVAATSSRDQAWANFRHRLIPSAILKMAALRVEFRIDIQRIEGE